MARITTPLTDSRIRQTKPAAKPVKLADGGGMYLLVRPDGSRYWRLGYRFEGKRKTLALGGIRRFRSARRESSTASPRLCWPRGAILAWRGRRTR